MSETNLEHYKLGSWYKANSVEEMRAFYMSRLPFIRDAAKKCGYAIGLHGSTKRDFDLMAMPWIEEPNTIDVLAREIMLAACGIEQSSFRWTKKPCGRKACSIPICWAEWDGCYDIKSLGCVDLSVIPHPAALPPCEGEEMPKPVQYSDGSLSREYEEYPTPPSILQTIIERLEGERKTMPTRIKTHDMTDGDLYNWGYNAAIDLAKAIVKEVGGV